MFSQSKKKSLFKGFVSRLCWPFVICLLMAAQAGAGQPGAYIPSINATVVGLRFFESGYDLLPQKDRVYSTAFNQSQTRYICWELDLQHPLPGRKIDFRIEARYYDSQEKTEVIYLDTYIGLDWENSNHASGVGKDKPGSFWPLGTYRVEIFVAGQKVTSGSFEVVSDKGVYPPPEEPANRVYPPPEKPDKKGDIPDDLGEL